KCYANMVKVLNIGVRVADWQRKSSYSWLDFWLFGASHIWSVLQVCERLRPSVLAVQGFNLCQCYCDT
ncbi:MAG: hypothetical protein LDL41_25360, partial [Coleofasciculus sp. S288]|nr:hypothetical protein [Coleofasciculus sp. S288]